jgi:hypothetical protein
MSFENSNFTVLLLFVEVALFLVVSNNRTLEAAENRTGSKKGEFVEAIWF